MGKRGENRTWKSVKGRLALSVDEGDRAMKTGHDTQVMMIDKKETLKKAIIDSEMRSVVEKEEVLAREEVQAPNGAEDGFHQNMTIVRVLVVAATVVPDLDLQMKDRIEGRMTNDRRTSMNAMRIWSTTSSISSILGDMEKNRKRSGRFRKTSVTLGRKEEKNAGRKSARKGRRKKRNAKRKKNSKSLRKILKTKYLKKL